MRVSERLQHGLLTWALICATAWLGFQVEAMGQTDSTVDNSNTFVPLEETKNAFTPLQATKDSNGSLDKNGPAKMTLLKARQALAHGDVTTAEMMVKSAQQYKVDFTVLGDSPQAVENMIAYQRELAKMAAAKDRSFNTQAAKFLLEQANTMVEYQDLDTAQMLMEQAKKFPVDFANFKMTPETLAAKIQSQQATMQLGMGWDGVEWDGRDGMGPGGMEWPNSEQHSYTNIWNGV